ncbi:phosphodiester glycosidase family protein [Olsenella sp. AM05-7]|uniref:phosphodiester glycosidase family protein n=1 Tax=Olsenella sp. AM05-7 TaxID=2292051 RepID=UPI001314123D|nr:phosphodiester glycosidase family protein [Olsenella sp. AM05-7]
MSSRARRIVSYVLSAILICSSVPTQALAEMAGSSNLGSASDTSSEQSSTVDNSDEVDAASGNTESTSKDTNNSGTDDEVSTSQTESTGTVTNSSSSESATSNNDGNGTAVEESSSETSTSDGESSSSDSTSEQTESITSHDQFLTSLQELEKYATDYVNEHSGEDVDGLIINFIRTGVERYTTSSWTTFCGEENTAFSTYVANQDKQNGTNASALKNIEQFTLPNGDEVDFGHMFGCLDMAYHTKNQGTADLGSWAGDTADLVWLVTTTGIESGTVDEMADTIRTNNDKYFLHALATEEGHHSFSQTDLYGDLDSFYILKRLDENSSIYAIAKNYFTSGLTNKIRARYFLDNRFSGASTKEDIRNDVYEGYTGNQGVITLEGTYLSSGVDENIRKACCYAFADWLYLTAYGEEDASYYKVFSSESFTLAPGITQVEKRAMTTDNKQIVYYLATADISRNDVSVVANYKDNDASSWGMQRVSDQMKAAEKKHSNADDADNYIKNYKAIAGINADFYNMSNGAPSGALVMNGVEYNGAGNEDFFAILKDGSPVIGTSSEWASYKNQVKEAVGAGGILVKDGKMAFDPSTSYTSNRVSRTCVGITYDGKVVFMVLDGRQEPFSAGGSPEEIAQVMIDAGCVSAVNLDGGGSSTFVSKAEGADDVSVVNSPSDGYERSVASSLMMVSTAKPSTEFDHALISSDYDYLSVESSIDLTTTGVSATGSSVNLPDGATLKVSDESIGTLSGNTFTAASLGDVTVQLVASDGSTVLGSKVLHVVQPTALKFTKSSVNAIYGKAADLPLEASYNDNPVKINKNDVYFGYLKQTLQSIGTVDGSTVNTTKTELVDSYPEAGTIDNFAFTPATDGTLRTLTIGAVLTSQLQDFANTINSEYASAYKAAIANGMTEDQAAISAQTSAINKALNTAAKIQVYMYNEDEASFDFNTADGKDTSGVLAWDRSVDDSTYNPDESYYILNSKDAKGTANYTLAVDMSKVPVPEKLSGLLYMLPGGDQEGRTAWDFMLQLAERISPLTTCTLEITIPEGFTVDTSNLRLANDFFKLNSATVNGNKLTITFGFITQTEPVNPTTANPICVLSGLKFTPKDDAAWTENGDLSFKLDGKVSYDIYAHFHSLKSLASQTEYQEKYGLYPYDNSENLAGDYGAHFADDVTEFSDSYELRKNVKSGWVRENGAWSYYDTDGKALTGIQQLPSFDSGEEGTFWYNLGDEGSCTDKYTGLFDKDGKKYYASFGVLASGWKAIQDDGENSHDYYFDPTTFVAATGETTINGMTYTFNDQGQLVRGAFYSDGTGIRYNWAGRDLWRRFVTLEEGTYWITTEQHVAYGYAPTVTTNTMDHTWYHFDEQTGLLTGVASGIFTYQGSPYYADENGKTFYGLIKTDKGIVFSGTLGKLSVDTGVYVDSSTGQKGCSLTPGWYYADSNGYLQKDGFATINGKTYHYDDYKISEGFTKVGDDYYLFNTSTGAMYHDATMWVGDNSYGISAGLYKFGADGKMQQTKDGFVEEDGKTYYYVDGAMAKGLTKVGDDWYLFNRSSGVMYTDGSYWVNEGENGSGLAGGLYKFGADGKMQQTKDGFVEEDGKTYYYVDGAMAKGLTKVGDDWYLFNRSSGVMYTDGSYWVNEGENGSGLAGGLYKFGADGKMQQTKDGFVEEDGKTYYYVDGAMAKGLTKVGDDWYLFNRSSGVMYTDGSYWVNEGENGSGLAGGLYKFGADGKMA